MTHLPECSVRTYTTDDGMVYEVAGDLCICDRLRACEQRIEANNIIIDTINQNNAYDKGYAAGVSAARDAVAAAPWDTENWIAHAQRAADLAAIDALRGDA